MLTPATAQTHLEAAVLGAMSQTQKDEYRVTPLTCGAQASRVHSNKSRPDAPGLGRGCGGVCGGCKRQACNSEWTERP